MPRNNWTREQQLVALRLYMRQPFGRLHDGNPEILRLAPLIGRTPGALGFKACNFASLDPTFRATNRVGLSNCSNADRELWAEFTSDPERVAVEMEAAYARLEPATEAEPASVIELPTGPSETTRVTRARTVQSFFRAAVLTSYRSRCAISGLAIPELLVASHIIPWKDAVSRRADPRNGLCLNAILDRAFDRGLIAIDEDLQILVSRRLSGQLESAMLRCSLDELDGRTLTLPNRFAPDAAALAYHRQHVFQA